MAPHSSVLAWRIPWREEPGGLQSMGLERVRHPHYRLGSGGKVGIQHQGGHRSYNDDHSLVLIGGGSRTSLGYLQKKGHKLESLVQVRYLKLAEMAFN